MNLSLHDKLFISTRPKGSSNQLAGLLTREGATVLEFPLIEIDAAPISEHEKKYFYNPGQFHWIIFTSSNGVRYFFHILNDLTGSFQLPEQIQFAVIGKKTEAALQDYGYQSSFVNPGSTAEDFSRPFLNHIHSGEVTPNILLPLGNMARTTIQDELKHKANCTRIDVYTTATPTHFDQKIVQRIEKGIFDMLIVTSPSGIKNLLKISPNLNKKTIPLACIGPVTRHEALVNGFHPLVTAESTSAEGICESIINHYISNK